MLNLGSEPNQNSFAAFKGKSHAYRGSAGTAIGPEIAAARRTCWVWRPNVSSSMSDESMRWGMPACASSAPRSPGLSANVRLADGLILGRPDLRSGENGRNQSI